jgi:hypothetical protein
LYLCICFFPFFVAMQSANARTVAIIQAENLKATPSISG